ncbi:MAG: LPP20 family lipoprotein [Candidatus Delongbacteria bacterium]|nr:LPP20 family lipoprotein [Candidatus Delongbacteria bacterium]MCG2760103.1 LPP20 family lipoprotein [Candidatus Delongbacteria bacterium]
MKKVSLIGILVLMISLLAQGEIDWERRVVTASGIGAPNPNAPNIAVKRAGAINAAKMYAIRDLMASIKGMYLSSEQTAENYMTTSDVVKTQVEGIARAFQMVGEPKYMEDGSVEVTVEMSIDGKLSDLMMKNETFGDTTPLAEEATYKLSDLVPSKPDIYTGLIIDCSEVQLRPALSPKVYSQSGKEVYGSANVNKDFAVQQGMVGYLKNVDSAKENARVTNNPFVVKAIGVKGTNKADIIISDSDASKIEELSSKLNFLRECRVIAIIK